MPDITVLLPEGLSLSLAFAFVGFSFFTSAITASLGLGGGIMMLAGLAMVFTPTVVIPFHGFVQLGSNGFRALMLKAYIHWQLILWIGLGMVLGSLLGGSLAVALPESVFLAAIGIFILYSVWGPQPKVAVRGPFASFFGGTAIAALGMIIGATGPLVANFLKSLTDRRDVVATHSMIMTINNLAKVTAFTLFGFAFGQYLPLMLAMIASGFLGTWLGSHLLHRMPERTFRVGFKAVLTLVALNLLRSAIWP